LRYWKLPASVVNTLRFDVSKLRRWRAGRKAPPEWLQTGRIKNMRICFGLAALFIVTASTSVLAQSDEAQQRRACRGDAIRLCWRFIPNHALITNCMAAKHDQLSPGCMQVFDAGMRKLGR
jgi:hypothetical protein